MEIPSRGNEKASLFPANRTRCNKMEELIAGRLYNYVDRLNPALLLLCDFSGRKRIRACRRILLMSIMFIRIVTLI